MIRRILFTLFFAATLRAEDLPSALKILDFARSQLPKEPIRMNGSLKERTENGFVKKELTVEMDLNWGADPANATYRSATKRPALFKRWKYNGFPAGRNSSIRRTTTTVPISTRMQKSTDWV